MSIVSCARIAGGYTSLMNTRDANRQLKTLNLRLAALREELEQPLTKRCGKAAEKCIRDDIDAVQAQVWEIKRFQLYTNGQP